MEIAKMLYLFSGVQGLILSSIFFFSKKHNKLANKYLAVFLFLFSFNIIRNHFADYHSAFVQNYPIIYTVTWGFIILFGPFLYLYVKALTGHEISLRKAIRRHFIIPIIYFAFLFYGGAKGLTTDEAVSKHIVEYYLYCAFLIFIMFQLLTYLILSLKVIWNYHKTLLNQYSNIDKLKLNWLFLFILGLLVQYVIWIIFLGGDLPIFKENISIHILNLFRSFTAIYVYWVGYYALVKPEIFVELKQDQLTSTTNTTNIQIKNLEINEYKIKLLRLLEEDKVYLNGSLTINQLAKKLDTNSKVASQVINTGFQKTFYDLINHYRIEEVKRNLIDARFTHYTLEAIALNSGFKSSTTFNRLFKSYTKQTPSQYRNARLRKTP